MRFVPSAWPQPRLMITILPLGLLIQGLHLHSPPVLRSFGYQMARSEPDTRRVYLAYRAVFVGPLALTSTPKAVKKVILKAENDRNDLTNDFGFDKVVAILVTLLKADVFKSELKAKHVFPDLFRTRSGRTGRLDPSEDNAARFQTALAEPTSAILRTCSRRRPAQANASEAIVAREAASLRDGAEVDHASSDQEGLVNDDVMVIDGKPDFVCGFRFLFLIRRQIHRPTYRKRNPSNHLGRTLYTSLTLSNTLFSATLSVCLRSAASSSQLDGSQQSSRSRIGHVLRHSS